MIKSFEEFLNENYSTEEKSNKDIEIFLSGEAGMTGKKDFKHSNVISNYHKHNKQYINVYVDDSGNVTERSLIPIFENIVYSAQKYKYSGINLISWASKASDVHKIESLDEDVADEMFQIVRNDAAEVGGVTDLKSLIDGFSKTIKDEENNIHIVITDGNCDEESIKRIEYAIKDINLHAYRHFLWVIYGRGDNYHKETFNIWDESIKYGKVTMFIEDR